jgi:hypothetical protein
MLTFPKMGANEQPSVVGHPRGTVPDNYREHFAQCKLQTAEERAAMAEGLWEMRGCNAATVGCSDAPRHQSPSRSQQDSGGDGRRSNNIQGCGVYGINGGYVVDGGYGGGGKCCNWSPTPGGTLQQYGGYGTAGGNLHEGPM